jgi:hypothetical protein
MKTKREIIDDVPYIILYKTQRDLDRRVAMLKASVPTDQDKRAMREEEKKVLLEKVAEIDFKLNEK